MQKATAQPKTGILGRKLFDSPLPLTAPLIISVLQLKVTCMKKPPGKLAAFLFYFLKPDTPKA
jgi:hypothetical protein